MDLPVDFLSLGRGSCQSRVIIGYNEDADED